MTRHDEQLGGSGGVGGVCWGKLIGFLRSLEVPFCLCFVAGLGAGRCVGGGWEEVFC